jgi:hypothetical protein
MRMRKTVERERMVAMGMNDPPVTVVVARSEAHLALVMTMRRPGRTVGRRMWIQQTTFSAI